MNPKTLQELEDELAEAENDLAGAWDYRQIELCWIAIEEIQEEIDNYVSE
jgi:hypothetical protein